MSKAMPRDPVTMPLNWAIAAFLQDLEVVKIESCTEVCKLLLNHPDFDLDLNDVDGPTKTSPLYLCVTIYHERRHEDALLPIFHLLLEAGFDLDGRPIDSASARGYQ